LFYATGNNQSYLQDMSNPKANIDISNPETNIAIPLSLNIRKLTEEESSSAARVEQVLRNQEDSYFKEIVKWGVEIDEHNPAEGVNYCIWRVKPDDTNLPDTSELKVDLFTDDEKADSAVLTALAGRTGIAWGPAFIGKKRQIILLSRPGPAVPVGPQDALSRLLAEAKAEVGVLSTKDDPEADHGNLGCAVAVTHILKKLGFPILKTPSTDKLKEELEHARWRPVPLNTPGAVIVSPTQGAVHGHTGIVGENGVIYSNDSATGFWQHHYTIDTWLNRYNKQLGLGSFAFAPPAEAAPAPAAPAEGHAFV
jgi:hypothetical protein